MFAIKLGNLHSASAVGN